MTFRFEAKSSVVGIDVNAFFAAENDKRHAEGTDLIHDARFTKDEDVGVIVSAVGVAGVGGGGAVGPRTRESKHRRSKPPRAETRRSFRGRLRKEAGKFAAVSRHTGCLKANKHHLIN